MTSRNVSQSSLLRRLRLPAKMALLTALFLVPLFVLLAIYVPKILGERAFTANERFGSELLVPVRKALDNMQKHRGTSQVAIKGDAAALARLPGLKSEVDAGLSKIQEIAAVRPEFKLTESVARISQGWNALKGKTLTAPESFKQHTALIEQILEFYKQLADVTNLTLDPELETYYLMDSIVLNLPEMTEHLGQMRAMAAGIAARKSMEAEERYELMLNARMLDDHRQAITRGMEKVASQNPSMKGLTDLAREVDVASVEAVDFINKNILDVGIPEVPPLKVFDTVTRAIEKAYSLYDKATPALSGGLEAREGRLQVQVAVAWVLLGLALLAAVFSYFIVKGIIGPTQEAVSVAQAVASGRLDNQIAVAGNDEIAELLSALDRMQGDLKQRIDSERAEAAVNLRIRNALDSASTNIMIADSKGVIVYANRAVLSMLRRAEADIRKAMPSFSVDQIVGGSFDRYHKNPAHQQRVIGTASGEVRTQIELGGRTFSLVGTPVFDANGQRLGMAVEWMDRTEELAIEREVASVIEAANKGNFAARIEASRMQGFTRQIGEGINSLLESTEKALSDIGATFERLAEGDLTEMIDGQYQGLLGELKEDANATIIKLRTIVQSIQEAADAINVAAKEIASGNSDLSARTEEQAGSLEETASSMEQLTGTVKQNADNAKEANHLALAAEQVAVKSGEVVHQMVSTMGGIHQSSSKIADIISVIDGIAFQTNILALNAAVEAARAGEQGRGFAVVATEVRNLAQRSAAAAKEIKTLISDSVEKVESGTRLADQAGETMEQVVSSIKRVARIMTDIAEASREQSSGIEQVGNAVTQMDEVTQQNAALVEQAAAAAEALQDQAATLVESVSSFRLAAAASGPRAGKVGHAMAAPARKPIALPPPRPAAAQAPRLSQGGQKAVLPPSEDGDEWEEF